MSCIRMAVLSFFLMPTAAYADGTVPPPLPPAENIQPPPLPPPPAEQAFFYADDGQRQGPTPQSALTQKITAGQVTCKALVWKNGMAEWRPASEVVEFREACAAVPPTPPPPATDWAAYMQGTWTIEGDYEGNRTVSTGTYHPGGRLVGVSEITISGAYYGLPDQTHAQPFEGKWIVRPLADKRFTLTTTISGAPKGKGENSSVLRVMGPNTLYNETAKATATRIE